jgi:hypothetical protein
MDKNFLKHLERIENKLDLIIKSFSLEFCSQKEKKEDPDQYHFPWYNNFKPANPSDVLK